MIYTRLLSTPEIMKNTPHFVLQNVLKKLMLTSNIEPGDDEVWINTSEDKDVAKNCETVHEG